MFSVRVIDHIDQSLVGLEYAAPPCIDIHSSLHFKPFSLPHPYLLSTFRHKLTYTLMEKMEQGLHLPQELVDQIIDLLHNDPSTLKSCALVRHSWLSRSRQRLFAKISLKAASAHNSAGQPQLRSKQLLDILTTTKELIPCIRELEICEGSPPHHQPIQRHLDVTSSTTWVMVDRNLIMLFERLTHVERFDFSSTSPIFWTLVPAHFLKAMYKLLSRPTLNYVRLHSWIFPNFAALSSMLSHCHNLRAFALSSTSISNDHTNDSGSEHVAAHDGMTAGVDNVPGEDKGGSGESDGGVPTAGSTPLEVLTLDFVNFAYLEYWLLGRSSLVDIKSLRELRVAHFHDAEIIKKLLLAVGGSLEHFHLKPGSWNVHFFDLSLNPGLRSIRLTLDDPTTAMEWAVTVLSSIDDKNVALDSVGMEFYADPKKITGWDRLDTLFMQPAFARLKQVEIGLFAQPSHADFLAVKEAMGGVEGKGIARWYQLGVKSHRSSRQLTPRISRYES